MGQISKGGVLFLIGLELVYVHTGASELDDGFSNGTVVISLVCV